MSQPPKRGVKGKGHGDQFFALGTVPAPPPVVVPSKVSGKREVIPTTSSTVNKKPRIEKPVESYELLERLESGSNNERVSGYIMSSLTTIKASRGKDSLSMLTLLYHAKNDPTPFQSDQIIETLVTFLKRDPGFSFKSKPSNALQIFAANLLMSILRDVKSWPISLIKVFVEDSLAERIWVDSSEVKGLVDNILTGFKTFVPTKSSPTLLNPDVATIKGEAPNSPNIGHNDDSSDAKDLSTTDVRLEDVTVVVRFTSSQEEQISTYIRDIVNEQLTRKPASEISRSLLRLLVSTVGVQSIRFLVAQKLEVWLQNPKLQKPAQDLSRILILNLNESDTEVVGILIKSLQKIRSKPIVNHFVSCVKELILMKEEMTYHFIREAMASFMIEVVTASRGSNNMQLIGTILTSSGSSEKSTKILAVLFQDFLIKEECLKTLRILLREVVRTLRYDHLSLPLFVSTLVQERASFTDMNFSDPIIRDRVFQSTIDLITLSMFLCVSPSVKEAASAPKGDRKDVMRHFQSQIADIARSGILWLHYTAMKLSPDRNEFMHGLNKLLLMESFEQYCNRDNWPPESERNLMFRLCCEVPFLEDTLSSILNMALTRSYPISPTEAIEVTDCLIKRAAACCSDDNTSSLEMKNEEIFDLLLNCSTYRMPDNIALPSGYQAPTLAIGDWYWKVWVQLLILTAHNTKTFGHKAWHMFPTLRLIIEMAITSHFEFPPPTQPSEEIRIRDLQLSSLEKQQILQFETHLAAASTKMTITESTSLLISKLITFDPMGVARRPPTNILEQLKIMNNNLKLGHLLCQSRSPDFLLEIIQRQQKSKTQRQDSGGPVSMPWLNSLVELHEDNFSALPIQCLCEFLLGQIHEDVCNKNGTNNTNKNNSSSSSGQQGTNSSSKESGTAERMKEREKKRKLKKLIVFFKNMLTSDISDLGERESSSFPSSSSSTSVGRQQKGDSKNNGIVAREMIDYFMKRLGCQQSLFRFLASKALDVIMAPNHHHHPNVTITSVSTSVQQQEDFSFDSYYSSYKRQEEEEEGNCIQGENGNNSIDCLFLQVLPQTKGFESVKQVACEALRWSLLVETNPDSICKYVNFLATYGLHTDSEIALNVAHLLIERQIVTRVIVSPSSLSTVTTSSHHQEEEDDDEREKKDKRKKEEKRKNDLKRSFLISCNKILYNYLIANLMRDPLQDWPSEQQQQQQAQSGSSSNSERVLVLWQTTGQTIVLHVSIIHAIVMLLIYGPVEDNEDCQSMYKYQMSRWFEPTPSVYSLETRQEETLFPESLKLYLAKSTNEILVNAGLSDLDSRTAILFFQSFGIPVKSMEKLLQILDERCQVESEKLILSSNIPDENFMKHLIEVQWMRGVTSGKKFALFLGLNPEPKTSLLIKESSRKEDVLHQSGKKQKEEEKKNDSSSKKDEKSESTGKQQKGGGKQKSGVVGSNERSSGIVGGSTSSSSVNQSSSSSSSTSLLMSPSKVSRLFAELLKNPCPVFRITTHDGGEGEEEEGEMKKKKKEQEDEDEQVKEVHIEALRRRNFAKVRQV